MDIAAACLSRHPETNEAARGVLRWTDAEGFTLHINVQRQEDGRWVQEWSKVPGRREAFPVVYRNAPRGNVDRNTSYRDARGAMKKAVAYVLEQQNAHGLIEMEARAADHRSNLKAQEARARDVEAIRAALRRLADRGEVRLFPSFRRSLTELEAATDDQVMALAMALDSRAN